ncbi:carbamoyl phosphate synthase small subunit [Peribacillus frigoritolerans]|nr:carbamoyl phosphate synthase small subunit [Peribacillus frigoritolerans]
MDTRAVVKNIRQEGSMQAVITADEKYTVVPSLNGLSAHVAEVSTKVVERFGEGDKHVVMMDFGYKKSILDSLVAQGCRVSVVPFDTEFEQIKDLKPDGILLSNGPGDPKQLEYLFRKLKKRSLRVFPTMGICLGHQLTALALGGNTKKNVVWTSRCESARGRFEKRKKVYMSSQNHSYEVDEPSLQGTSLQVRFRNVNDNTVEGLMHEDLPIFTTQYHPEANPGPIESSLLFKDFLQMINDYSGREKAYA